MMLNDILVAVAEAFKKVSFKLCITSIRKKMSCSVLLAFNNIKSFCDFFDVSTSLDSELFIFIILKKKQFFMLCKVYSTN